MNRPNLSWDHDACLRGELCMAPLHYVLAQQTLGDDGQRLNVFDRVTVTKEAARDLRAYREGLSWNFRLICLASGWCAGRLV